MRIDLRLWLVVVVVGLGVDPARARADNPPPASAPAAPASWTDPRVVDELTKSCAFDPDAMDARRKQRWTGKLDYGDTSVMSCAVEADQSCSYDPCFNAGEEKCKPRCTTSCRGCGKGCATQCDACKKDCKDAACKRACATTCATCHEACVRERDHCATASCTDEYKACRTKMKVDWQAHGCNAVCVPYTSCIASCSKGGKDLDVCFKRCKPKGDTKGCDLGLCKGDFAMGIDPEEGPPKDSP